MSKAFTKGDEGVPDVPSRPVVRLAPGETRYITAEGHAALSDQLRVLKESDRPAAQAAPDIERRQKLAEVDAKIAALEALLAAVTIAPEVPANPERVVFGAWVELEDENGQRARWRIVGPDEADPKAEKLSVQSPIARALLGKAAGDVVTVERPSGAVELEVLAVAAS
ncbi:MAG: GreA/GreB family elongation factor [Myxococcaceae bacterium]